MDFESHSRDRDIGQSQFHSRSERRPVAILSRSGTLTRSIAHKIMSNNSAISPEGYNCFAWIDDPSSLRDGAGVAAIVQHFVAVCGTDSFLQYCESLGLGSPSFRPNPCLTMEWPGYHKFATGYEQEIAQQHNHLVGALALEGCNIPSKRRLGLVFHGTRQENVDNILLNGLDPTLRRGQSFGPGEYFSTTPTISIRYCHGGSQLIVCVVVLPEGRDNKAPKDYIVIANNNHHLAIGTLSFGPVEQPVLTESERKRQNYQRLDREAAVKRRKKTNADDKAQIMTLLIKDQINWAAEVYQRKSSTFDETTKREIAWYVLSKLDKHVADYYFPNLPPPLSRAELIGSNVASVDTATREESQAVAELERAREKLTTAGDDPSPRTLCI